jgi:hypothetical protein
MMFRNPSEKHTPVPSKHFSAAVLLLLSSCVDLSAVSKFATNSASVLSSNTGALITPPGADFLHAEQVAHSPALQRLAPDEAKKLNTDAGRIAENRPLAKTVAETLQLYFSTLSEAADTGKTDVTAQADSIDASLAKLTALGSDTQLQTGSVGSILKLLRIPLDLAQQTAVRRLVIGSDSDVQVLTQYLQQIAAQQAEAAAHAGVVLDRYFTAGYDGARDPGTQALIRAQMWDQAAANQATVDSLNRTRAAIATIGKDHALLAANAEHLSSATVLATLKADAPLIQAAIKPFL